MTAHSRTIVAILFVGCAALTGVLAQTPAPAGAGQPPAGQPPAQPPAGTGQAPSPPAQPQGRGGRGGFTQFTRPLASQDVLLRGKALYETNCASCHAADLRGGPKGTNLLRSGIALRDKQGELVGEAIAKHSPPIRLMTEDSVAVAEYIHSIHATMGGQGSPPGRNPVGIELKVLVGDAAGGEVLFRELCSSCHSTSQDLKGIGAKFGDDARALQNAWISGTSRAFGGGGRGGAAGAGNPVTVTFADGSKVEGTLVRKNDFLVILTMADGTRVSYPRDPNTGMPRVEISDPQDAHKKLAMTLAFNDPENKKLHDITAYLATVK